MPKIYCAGPLFNEKEREEMAEIASTLEAAGFEVFLPQRDGLEMARIATCLEEEGMQGEVANGVLARAIFLIDTFHVADSDGLILNLNGRVPDEGAMVEAGIAWALGKPIVTYKNDSRSALLGVDNPLVLGLSSFKTVSDIEHIVDEFRRELTNAPRRWSFDVDEPEYKLFKRGKQLHRIFSTRKLNRTNAERIGKVLEAI